MHEANRESFVWLTATGMLHDADSLERYKTAKFGWLTARAYPHADRDMLRLLMDWCVWLFAFDDGFCESERMSRHTSLIARALPDIFRVLDDLESPEKVENVFARTLLELKQRLSAYAERDQLARWCAATREYVFAQVWEAANREADVIPTPDDYIFMRRRTGAMFPVYALIDIAGGYRLTSAEWHHPDVQTLTELANDLVVWDNDLFSYAKEMRHDKARHNLVNVLVTHRACTVQAALDEVAWMHNRAVDRMIELHAAVATWGSPGLLDYILGLKHWVRGHIEYSRDSARYIHAWPPGTHWPVGLRRPDAAGE
ncbi:MAG TPA: hypothetical protein VIR33_06590 [Thermopolyspora sp.]